MRPRRLVVVAGTGTEIGKTWVTAALAGAARRRCLAVSARKPVQSFAVPAEPGSTDAEVLAAATGERPGDVCPPHRSYPRPMAPPMAADVLGLPAIALDDLLEELRWPPGTAVGLVETVGGVCSPLAHDADSAQLARRLAPDLVVLVADARLGTISAVRTAVAPLAPLDVVVLLNRFDPGDDLQRRNRAWLAEHDGLTVAVDVAEIDVVAGGVG